MKEYRVFQFKKIYDGISKKKRVAGVLLVIVIIILMFILSSKSGEKVVFRNGTFTGITSEGMKDMTDTNDENSTIRNTTMWIKHLDVHNDVDISGSIRTTEGDVDFHFTGDLYVSEKQEQGIEAYVGQITDRKNNFAIKYFEIKNDTSYDLLKYEEEYLNKRIISFDLERNGIYYYFELDMDELGVSFYSEDITENALDEIDFSANYVDKEKSVAPCILPYDSELFQVTEQGGTHSYSAKGIRWYNKEVVRSWFGGEIIYEYFAEPEIYGVILDLETVGSVMWTSELKLGTYVEKDGTRIDAIDNVFRISGSESMEVQMSAGANTAFTSGGVQGICKINGVEDSIKSSFVTSVSEGNMYVVRNQFDSTVVLDEAEYYIRFYGFTATIDSSVDSNQVTDCSVLWRYNTHYKNKVLDEDGEEVEAKIHYIVNVK